MEFLFINNGDILKLNNIFLCIFCLFGCQDKTRTGIK